MKLSITTQIPAAPALSNPPTATELALLARVTALEQTRTEITEQAEKGWGQKAGWAILSAMIIFLALSCAFLKAWKQEPDWKDVSNAETAAGKAQDEASKANADLLTKDSELSTAKNEAAQAKEASAKAIAEKVNAEKAAAEAKTAADNAVTELTALKKAQSDAVAKAKADADAAKELARQKEMDELKRQIAEKQNPQLSPSAPSAPSAPSVPSSGTSAGGDIIFSRIPAGMAAGTPAVTTGWLRGFSSWSIKSKADLEKARKGGNQADISALERAIEAFEEAMQQKGLSEKNSAYLKKLQTLYKGQDAEDIRLALKANQASSSSSQQGSGLTRTP